MCETGCDATTAAYIFDDHDQKRQLDAQRFLLFARTRNERGRHVRAHDLEHGALDVGVGDSFDVPVPDLAGVPNLQGL